MSVDDDWGLLLTGHPIFSKTQAPDDSPEFSISTLRRPVRGEPPTGGSSRAINVDGTTPSSRRNIMCMKDTDLMVAVGSEIRMTCLGDAKISGSSQKTYRTLHTPNINFEIHQICLSPNKKLLAVAGTCQVAVIMLPRSGLSRMVASRIDCKSLQIGHFYHSRPTSPIAKVDWHPWGEAGSTLLVMTVDGKLREYDVSIDPEEPRQTVDFVTEKRRSRTYAAIDESEKEVASFTFGKGKADWGPLTIYALMRSGDIYAICPYLPESASVPSSYLHALECFVAAKEEFVSESDTIDEAFTTLYDYQRKYVNGLLKQVPPDVTLPSSSRTISIRSPKSFSNNPARQGPFLLQPSAPELQGSPGGDATDLVYVTLGSAMAEMEENETDPESNALVSERLGVVLIAYQDGRVDVCLDLEKIEGRWETKQAIPDALPMLTVYEVIDLGIIRLISPEPKPEDPRLGLLQKNYPVLYPDPIHDDTVYTYHTFGVHVLNLNPLFQILAASMKEEDEESLKDTVRRSSCTMVHAIVNTYSIEKHTSDPVVAGLIPSDVYLTYSIFIVTASMHVASLVLYMRPESAEKPGPLENKKSSRSLPELPPPDPSSPPAYTSILGNQLFVKPAVLERPMGLPSIAKLVLPTSHSAKDELCLTPETLRYLGNVSERISNEIHDVLISFQTLKQRVDYQRQEYECQQKKAADMFEHAKRLSGPRKEELKAKITGVLDGQKKLMTRADRVLQALIRQASPELNEHETHWFGELQRMRRQVLGAGKYDPNSLSTRVRQIQNDLDRFLPALKELAKKEAERKGRLEETNVGAGYSFAESYERLSKHESMKLENAMKQIVKLAGKLGVSSLSPPFP